MVGNDVEEDLIAASLGMSVFLLTDCLINRNHADLSPYPQGGFDALADYIRRLKQAALPEPMWNPERSPQRSSPDSKKHHDPD